ncbi:unnamed protein product [Periconia digitata]|uniref:Uncharacterized protein n=1 Tax=Periconia digitata TaxID=1303443 RepID=A0A9W4XIN1_9PLEO|nr:unnamed protein product [Periconia digitata]
MLPWPVALPQDASRMGAPPSITEGMRDAVLEAAAAAAERGMGGCNVTLQCSEHQTSASSQRCKPRSAVGRLGLGGCSHGRCRAETGLVELWNANPQRCGSLIAPFGRLILDVLWLLARQLHSSLGRRCPPATIEGHDRGTAAEHMLPR